MAEEKEGDNKKGCIPGHPRLDKLVTLVRESSEPLIPESAPPGNREFYEQAIVPDRPYAVFT